MSSYFHSKEWIQFKLTCFQCWCVSGSGWQSPGPIEWAQMWKSVVAGNATTEGNRTAHYARTFFYIKTLLSQLQNDAVRGKKDTSCLCRCLCLQYEVALLQQERLLRPSLVSAKKKAGKAAKWKRYPSSPREDFSKEVKLFLGAGLQSEPFYKK